MSESALFSRGRDLWEREEKTKGICSNDVISYTIIEKGESKKEREREREGERRLPLRFYVSTIFPAGWKSTF